MIERWRLSGLLRSRSTPTIDIKMINYTIARGTVAGLLIPRSISTSDITMINYTIEIGRVVGLKQYMSMYSITIRQFNNFITRNTIVIVMVGGRMADLSRPIYKNSITTYLEITFSADRFVPDLLVLFMS